MKYLIAVKVAWRNEGTEILSVTVDLDGPIRSNIDLEMAYPKVREVLMELPYQEHLHLTRPLSIIAFSRFES